MVFELLFPCEVLTAHLAIGMLRFCVNFLMRIASAFVRKCLLAVGALVTKMTQRWYLIHRTNSYNLRFIVEMNSLVANKIGALNKSLFTEAALLSYTRVYQQMFFVGVAPDESLTAIFAGVDNVLVN